MASGNYARKASPQQPMEIQSRVPARATRKLPAIREEEREAQLEVSPPGATIGKAFQHISTSGQLALRVPQKVVDQFEPHPLERHKPWLTPWLLCTVCVVIFVAIFISAGMYQRPSDSLLNYPGGKVYDVQVGGSLANASSWQANHPVPAKTAIPTQSGPYGVLSAPSISADFINRVLDAYHSPAAGKGQALYDMGKKYGIDPAFALAFFMHESTFGTRGEATASLSLGNLRCIPNFRCQDNYAWFNSWEDGFNAWYELIRNWYVAHRGLVTVDQIIPVYAPAADNNNEAAYIASLKHAIDTWHAGVVMVS